MLTAGVDLATRPDKTAIAMIRWSGASAVLLDLVLGATDEAIVTLCQASDFVGIDAPFGWPDAFISFVAQHGDTTQSTLAGRTPESRQRLAYRLTDLVVAREFSRWPLSVSTDRIGLTAMRASSLLAQLRDLGQPVSRRGDSRVAEVYPAVALKTWGLRDSAYKGTNSANLSSLVDSVLAAAPWLSLGAHEIACRQSDDAFDAVIAALVSRAHALGAWREPADDQKDQASREGWIVVPTLGLSALIG